MSLRASTMETPFGAFSAIADDGVVLAAGFAADVEDMRRRLDLPRRVRPMQVTDDLGPVGEALRGYFDGDVDALDRIEVDQAGGEFRTAAWKAMRAVPAGETITYAELAAHAGSPRASQAAGSACSQNRIALIVPCHRIVGTGGGLGGYYYGLDLKSGLLEHERRHGHAR
ncbi:MAG: methylated-DNA--[protein]-cysteine S-methyltransferase [Actinomycetota bacterium]|nr:methylated-DNA--[protein]-cysteine S-methyltransferase [Actinomycetota bacterium]